MTDTTEAESERQRAQRENARPKGWKRKNKPGGGRPRLYARAKDIWARVDGDRIDYLHARYPGEPMSAIICKIIDEVRASGRTASVPSWPPRSVVGIYVSAADGALFLARVGRPDEASPWKAGAFVGPVTGEGEPVSATVAAYLQGADAVVVERASIPVAHTRNEAADVGLLLGQALGVASLYPGARVATVEPSRTEADPLGLGADAPAGVVRAANAVVRWLAAEKIA